MHRQISLLRFVLNILACLMFLEYLFLHIIRIARYSEEHFPKLPDVKHNPLLLLRLSKFQNREYLHEYTYNFYFLKINQYFLAFLVINYLKREPHSLYLIKPQLNWTQ